MHIYDQTDTVDRFISDHTSLTGTIPFKILLPTPVPLPLPRKEAMITGELHQRLCKDDRDNAAGIDLKRNMG